MPAKELQYLEPSQSLSPSSAAVALIIDEDGRYLVQLRDDMPSIFFPDHWGCFGGAIDNTESPEDAVVRELFEELTILIDVSRVSLFTRLSYDAPFIGYGAVDRVYFEVKVANTEINEMVLQEGAKMEVKEGPDLLTQKMVPFDHFAVWMHYYRLGFK